MTDTNDTPLPLLALSVQHYKRLKLVQIQPEASGITQIRGLNEQGKSSIIDAADVLLHGLRFGSEDPIHHGEARAVIRGDFGDIIVTRTFTDPSDASKSKLVVTNANGAEYPKPTEVLERYLRQRMDPVAFCAMKSHEQVRVALDLVDVPLDLAAHATKLEIAEQVRRDAGREVKRLEGAVATLLPKVAGAPAAEVDVTALAERLAEGERINAAAKAASEKAAAAKDARQRAQDRVGECDGRIAALERELAEARAEKDKAVRAVESAQEAFMSAVEAAVEANESAVDLEPIRAEIQEARAKNQAHAVRVQYEKEVALRDAAVAEHERTEAAVQELRKERLDALASVVWPSPGLGYDPDAQWLTLHGVPFSEASGAQKLVAAADIAMARPGAIRMLLVHELSTLDSAHRALLHERVASRGFQMLAARMDENVDGPGVFIEDGEIVARAKDSRTGDATSGRGA